MRKLSFAAFAICAVVLVFAACGEKKFRGYSKTKTGLYYKITTKNNEGKSPQEGDYLIMEVALDADFDSTIVIPMRDMESQLYPSIFQGDVYEAYAMLKEGEVGEFYIKADSFIMYFMQMMPPPTVKPEDVLHFTIKMKEIKPKEVFEQEMAEKQKEYMEMLEVKKQEEKPALAKYIAEQKITVKPTTSGLYFIEKEKGKGAKAENGKTVSVHYTGKFLDGKVFDSSLEHGKPLEFVLGNGMIPGFTEGLLLMKEGGKATFIIPSDLGYGDGGGRFPPFASLVFEVEVLKVSDAQNAVENQ